MKPLNIVLVEPEIPQNAGNISRTCAATGSRLHLIKPLGFELSDRQLKRAGLDYWHLLDITVYENLDEFFQKNPDAFFYLSTTKATQTHAEVAYPEGCYLLFGKETRGLPEELLMQWPDRCIRLPMIEGARSLNLSNSVAVVVYEALRQLGFENLKTAGRFPTGNQKITIEK